MRDIPAIGVCSVSVGAVDIGNSDGVTSCFGVYVSGHAPDTTARGVELVVDPRNLADFLTVLVKQARATFPEDMKDVPPL